jgi:hypothetical protein
MRMGSIGLLQATHMRAPLGSKADMCNAQAYVRLVPTADMAKKPALRGFVLRE